MPRNAFHQWQKETPPEAGWLVGFSGGLDSTVLADLAARARPAGEGAPPLVLAHIHHGLRGPDADADAEFCRVWCAARGLAFRLLHVDVPRAARAARTGFEAAGRKARHACFASLIREYGDGDKRPWRVLLAHHAGDQAETVWHHLQRGADARGLAGLAPAATITVPPSPPAAGEPTSLHLARPLLYLPKEALAAYAAARGLAWREDATNRDTAYTRNRLRHETLPALESASPGAVGRLLALGVAARAHETRRQGEAETLAATRMFADGAGFAVHAGDPAHPAWRRALRCWWEGVAGERLRDAGDLERLAALAQRRRGRLKGRDGLVVTRTAVGLRVSRDFAPNARPDVAIL